MIHHYYVKFMRGTDWITVKDFTYKEEDEAIACAIHLSKYLIVRVYCDNSIIHQYGTI